MSRILNSSSMRNVLSRSLINVKSGKHQLNQMFKRTVYQKIVAKPAPFFTKELIIEKFKDSQSGEILLGFFLIAYCIYFEFYGVDYEEIKNFKELKAE